MRRNPPAEHLGRVYFWDHENKPDRKEWNGAVVAGGNVTLFANSFSEFVAGFRGFPPAESR